jgi:glycerol-3-phosphate cytidylyltransferase
MSAAFKYKTGIVCGAFDVIHPGYIRMFEDAKSICENLVVLLQVDPTIDRPEKAKPLQSIEDREYILRSIKYVDDILVYTTEEDLYNILKKDFYDVRIMGTDYLGKIFTGSDLNRKIYWHDRSHQYSATKFKKNIAEALKK